MNRHPLTPVANGGRISATLSATATTRFKKVVKAKLMENRLAGRTPSSLRGLARSMGGGDPTLTETYKRSLFKWMAVDGPRASEFSRALVAHALGNCTPEELAEDDEESDPVSSLTHALNAIVEAAVAKAMDRVPA